MTDKHLTEKVLLSQLDVAPSNLISINLDFDFDLEVFYITEEGFLYRIFRVLINVINRSELEASGVATGFEFTPTDNINCGVARAFPGRKETKPLKKKRRKKKKKKLKYIIMLIIRCQCKDDG